MSSDDNSARGPSSQDVGPAFSPPSAWRRLCFRYLAGALSVLSVCASAWLAHRYRSAAELAADADDTLALSVIGGWWNIVGDRQLVLEWEGYRATLIDYSASDAGVESTGTWHTIKDHVIVRVQGAGGALDRTFELVGNESELFLAPAPSAQARLLESWVADHDDDAEDMSPSDSPARETRADARLSVALRLQLAPPSRRELVLQPLQTHARTIRQQSGRRHDVRRHRGEAAQDDGT